MHALLLGIFASALASFAGIYGLLSWVCYLADHDRLVMLHMYSSSIILSGAYGIILPLNIDKLHALGSRLKRRIH